MPLPQWKAARCKDQRALAADSIPCPPLYLGFCVFLGDKERSPDWLTMRISCLSRTININSDIGGPISNFWKVIRDQEREPSKKEAGCLSPEVSQWPPPPAAARDGTIDCLFMMQIRGQVV